MSEFDFDDLLSGAVSDYREATLSQIKPAGTLAARATATHRRRVHMISMSVLAAVLVITPISAYAAIDHNHNGPPTVASSPTVTPTITPSTVAPTVTPSIPPSTPPSSTPATATLAPITAHQLENATLNFGTVWGSPCPHGNVKLINGRYDAKSADALAGDKDHGLIKVVTADVNHDGVGDAVGLFGCDMSDPGIYRVIAFDRAASGTIHTMGDLASGILTIRDISANSNGTIRVQVSNLAGSDGEAAAAQVVQWRTYGWNGKRFTQTAGFTSFTTSPKLSVQVSDLVYGPSSKGKRSGTMIVTLHNTGTHSLADTSVVVEVENAGTPVISTKCPVLPWVPSLGASMVCSGGSIAAGATTKVTLRFTITDGDATWMEAHPSLQEASTLVQIRVGAQALTKQPTLGNAVFN